jgi:hypothetical protein
MVKTLKERYLEELFDDVDHGLNVLDMLIDMINLMPEDTLYDYLCDHGMLPEEEGEEEEGEEEEGEEV